eukprot:jgi/Mesen1/6283/ME000324S05321
MAQEFREAIGQAQQELPNLGQDKGQTRELEGHPISKEEASHIQAEEQRAGHDVGHDSLAARARSAASANAREGKTSPGPFLGDVKPFNEEPHQAELREHAQEFGGRTEEKKDILGAPITLDDARKVTKMEVRAGRPTGAGSLAARISSAAAANEKNDGGRAELRDKLQGVPEKERESARSQLLSNHSM